MVAKAFFKELLPVTVNQEDAKSGNTRELASTVVKTVTFKSNSATDYEDPDFSFEDIQEGYNTDSYIRQGVDKYVDQVFKEGFNFYGKDSNVVTYLKLRLEYIAEATGIPIDQFLIDIAEDIVKYANCIIIKVRNSDPNSLPQGVKVTGLNGKDPVVGYFCADPVTMTVKRDKNGIIQSWKQETDAGQQEFAPEDVIHFYYKRSKGNAYGTSFLVPVLDDVRALRQAEENVLKMMYRNIYPFNHITVGTDETPGTEPEVQKVIETVEGMDVEGGIVTTERVKITPIATNQVIDAEPYLRYLEERVFSGMGIPAIMFGRGNTANRSTGDNMTSEMADRIRAITKILEMFFNAFVVKEILMEGGYDPVLNPDQIAELKFHDNDVDVKIKKEVHIIYKYEHNAITEDEMRDQLGMDPVADADREKMFVNLITRETAKLTASLKPEQSTGTGETNNKEKNAGGKPKTDKTKPKTKAENNILFGLIKDSTDDMTSNIEKYINDCYSKGVQILQQDVVSFITKCSKDILLTIKAKEENASVTESISQILIKNSAKLCNQIHDDMAGMNTYNNPASDVIDMINIRVDIFTDSLIKYIKTCSLSTKFIERSS
jgi:hypothetical protein